jgi:hypothetical protein
MRKWFLFLIAVVFSVSVVGGALAQDKDKKAPKENKALQQLKDTARESKENTQGGTQKGFDTKADSKYEVQGSTGTKKVDIDKLNKEEQQRQKEVKQKHNIDKINVPSPTVKETPKKDKK